MKNKALFCLLSFTWGLPMTIIGLFAAGYLMILGYKPQKWEGGIYFTYGKSWGGISLGPVTLTSSPTRKLLVHEFGHAVQNCFLGPWFPFIVGIPSFTRYWYRDLGVKWGFLEKASLPDYHSIWFEADADALGEKYIEYLSR